MLIALLKNARTTPAVRAEIAASSEIAGVLAQRYGITEQTVYKWKKRSVFGDRSHTAHRLQTVLTPAQETVVVHLRRTLLLPLDDLLAVTREFICPQAPGACGGPQGFQELRAGLPAHGREVPAPDAGREQQALTKLRTPRTNGMVERFNGRIADMLKTHRFNSREDMEQTLLRYVALYNYKLPQSALKSKTPMQAMKDWYQEYPHLLHKRPHYRQGCDA